MTERVQDALNAAYTRALNERNSQTNVEHLLGALLEQDRGIAPDIVRAAGVEPKTLAAKNDEQIAKLPRLSGSNADQGSVTVSPDLTRLLSQADAEAKQLQDDYVSVEHLLLAMTQSNGAAGRTLRDLGLTRDKLLAALRSVRGNQRVTTQNPEGTYKSSRALRPRSHAGGRTWQARPGNRPRRRDTAHHSSALTPDEKQPGADRRSRRRQNCHRRGSCPTHRPRRRARGAQRQTHRLARYGRPDRGREVPRRV